MREILTFPDPVNETAARVVATGVVLQGVAFLATESGWLLVPLVYGFVARVLTGPTLSPLGLVATRIVAPRLAGPHRNVPGPPKRFAQGIGVVCSALAAALWWAGALGAAQVVLVALVGAATLEAGLGVCLGCVVYHRLFGCADCDDLSRRIPAAPSSAT